MKPLKLSLGFIVFMLVFVGYRMPSTTTQTVEPSLTPEGCRVDRALIPHVQFSSDGHYLVANWPPHSLRVWNTTTGAIAATFTDEVLDGREIFAISPDSQYIITGGNTGVVILWNTISGEKERPLRSQTYKAGPIQYITFSPNGQSVLISYSDGHTLWNLTSGAENPNFTMAKEGGVASGFSPDGNLIFTQSMVELSYINIWDRKSGRLVHTFNQVARNRKGMFSPGGRYILIPKDDETILADANTYDTVHTLEAATSDWQFSPNGKYLLARKVPGTIFLWNVETGKRMHEFPAHTPAGFAVIVSFLKNNSVFLAKDSVETPKPQTVFSVRNIDTGIELQEVIIGIDLPSMQSLAMAPNAQYIAISSFSDHSSIVTLWDIQTSKQIRQYC